MNEAERDVLHERLSELIEDRLSPEGEAELQRFLSTSPEARALYRASFALHADLSLADEAKAVAVPAPLTRRRRIPLAAAAAAMLLAGIWLGRQGGGAPAPARVVESGASVPAGELAAPDDRPLRLEMASGAGLTLQAGSRVEIVDSKAVRLIRGRLSVDVPERAIGFRVVTAGVDVVDLGTEFGVAVDDNGATEVHVFRGVVVTRTTAGSRVVPLGAREAGVLDPASGELQPIPLNAARFGIEASTRRPRHEPTVARGRLPDGARVVFLGDRMTARGTHLTLLNQTLRSLPEVAAPRLFNAAIAFRLFFTEEDVERYIRAYRPTHAVLEFGPDVLRGREPETPAAFDAALRRLVDRLRNEGVEPILATGHPVDDGQELLDRYNEAIRALAAERALRLADVDRALRSDRSLMLPKGNLPTFEGFRLVTAVLLAAMGYADVEVPASVDPAPLPGLIREWRYRHRPVDAPIGEDVDPDGAWQTLVLPMEDKFSRRLPDPSHSWTWQDARQGFAQGLFRRGQRTEAVAEVRSEAERPAALNVGGAVRAVWLNGERVYLEDRHIGGVAGKARVPVRLRAGVNRILVDCGATFFVSVTDAVDWPLPR